MSLRRALPRVGGGPAKRPARSIGDLLHRSLATGRTLHKSNLVPYTNPAHVRCNMRAGGCRGIGIAGVCFD